MKATQCGDWDDVASLGALHRAYLLARRGKKSRVEVARFALELERELVTLHEELDSGRYVPGAYRIFTIYERKPRIIAAAPFRDRIVHHALMHVVEPQLDARFIFDSYACRRGKGVHRAVDRYQQWSTRYAYVLKLDIRRYFESIDHAVLKRMLAAVVAEPRILDLLSLIIDHSPATRSGKGIPIGNLTSQIFANLYLDGIDHFVKQSLGVKAYLRYVDDLVLLGDDKDWLWRCRDAIAECVGELGLELHPRKAQIYRTSDRVELLGYHLSRNRRWLRNDNGYRARRRIRALAEAYSDGHLDLDEVRSRIHSWLGHARHAETTGLCESIFRDIVFVRAPPA